MSKALVAAHPPWLCVVAGRPGTGKTTLARQRAHVTRACCLRVDVVEAALWRVQDDVGTAGYAVVHELAASNLLVGLNVIVDAVNPIPEARRGWHDTASRCGASLVLLETVLPDLGEHRRRVEWRVADIPGHRVPTWSEVCHSPWVPWSEPRDGTRHIVDTASPDGALQDALGALPSF